MPDITVYPEWTPTLSDFTFDPEIARRLPPALAFRYLAIPVAEERGRVTVLIADPYNQQAVAEIAAALPHHPYLVKSDPAMITNLLQQTWPEETQPTILRLLVATPPGPIAAPFRAYVQRLGNLLHSQIIYLPLPENAAALDTLSQSTNQQTDLVALQEPTRSWLTQFLHGSLAQQAIRHIPTSILLARQPRWPLRRLLLIIHGDEREEAILSWVLRLAQPVKAEITLLAVTPAHPWLYNREGRALQGLAALLEPDTLLTQQARQMAQQITQAGLQGELRLRQGPPAAQIRQEIAACDPDLILTCGRADETGHWFSDFILSSHHWLDRPVLLVRSGESPGN
ncbi:MAG: universal stress protein [Chloroflexi bacterium]|nr:universal stress protein [Chloroflexota bacterium]